MEREIKTQTGICVYTYEVEHAPDFFVSLFLRAGSMYERAEEGGITHFLEHTLVRNVNKLMDGGLYATLDERGVEFNAATYSEMVQFYVWGASKNFSVATDIISALLKPIALTSGEVGAERKRIKAEIRESDDKDSMSTLAAMAVHAGTTLSSSILGTNKSVDGIGKTALEEYRRRVFVTENVFLYVTGSFTEKDVRALCAAVDGAWLKCAAKEEDIHTNVAPVSRNFGKRVEHVHLKNADYTSVRFSFDMDMQDLDCRTVDLVYDMLLHGFNSPFFIKMSEERGLFYDITGAVERYKNIGVFYFGYELKEKNLYDAVEMSVKILNDFMNTTYPENKLMKAGYVDNAYLLTSDLRDLTFTLAYDNHILCDGYPSIDVRRALYEGITAEEIRAAARKIFTLDALTLTVKGNKRKIDVKKLEAIIERLGK